MASAGSIFVDLLLRDTAYSAGWNRARRTTGQASSQIQGDMGRIKASFSGVLNPITNITSALKGLAATAAASLSVQKIIQYSDSYKQLESRLSIVTADSRELASVQEQLYQIAIQTRQPLEGIYNLYTRLAQAIPESQRGQFDLLGVVDSINKALAITGEGSAQAASAILQFTQAAASGFQASGQEINALLDSAPRLAKAIQQSFGDGTTSLKELSKEGLLTTETVLKALSSLSGQAQLLDEEFGKTSLTVSQAFTQLETAFFSFIGTNDQVSASTSFLAERIQGLALFFENLTPLIDQATFSLQKFLSKGGDGTVISPAQMANALPPEFTQYSPGQMQAAIDMAKRMDEARGTVSKEQQKKAQKEANDFQKEVDRQQKMLQGLYEKNEDLIRGISRETLDYIETERELNQLYDERLISYDQLYTALSELDARYDESTKKVDEFGVDSEQFAKRAAENIQDAFADFLFDPFAQGLAGMAKGFVDTIRRMIAEAQAAKLAKALFGELAGGEGGGLLGNVLKGSGGGNFLGGLFDGFFATGGYIEPGHFGVVGEGGGMQHAELLYGGKTGATVIPQGQSNKGGNVYQIDARGADQGAVRRLENALLTLAGPGVIESRVANAQTRGAL